MKRLFWNILKLFSIVALMLLLYFGLFFWIVPSQYTDAFTAAMVDKVKTLESTNAPKIILIGDSNLVFGMDSNFLEEELRMPVVNMGLHGGLGNKRLERFAWNGIGEDDLVIVCHSNFSDDGKVKQGDLTWITLEKNFDLWKTLDLQEILELLPALPDYSFNVISLWLSGRGNKNEDIVYARSAFNKWGDNVSVRESNICEIDGSAVTVPKLSEQCAKRLNRMSKYCKDRGARLVIAGYPIMLCEETPSPESYIKFKKELEEKIDCKVISEYTDYFFPEKYFYDGCLHMTNEGARLRTEQMIKDISSYFQEEDSYEK